MQLFHRHFGKKGNPPLIILHGLFGISDNWATFGRQLADVGFEVFIPDQRNHGRSEWSDDFNYLALTNDLYDLMDAEDIENPVLLGHSMGGKVAMRFAISYPGLVQKLIVVDIAPKAYTIRQQHQHIIRAMQHTDLKHIKSRTEAERLLAETIPEKRIRQFILKNLHRKENNIYVWRINIDAIAQNLNRMYDILPETATFDKPTLFIAGGASEYILPEDESTISNYFPLALIKTIPGASHWVHADAPDEFFHIVTHFLSDTKPETTN